MKPEQSLFVELYNYHGETLYPLVRENQKSPKDLLLCNKDLLQAKLIDSLVVDKAEFSFVALVKCLFSLKFKNIYINSISVNLHAKTIENWCRVLVVLASVLIAKLLGARVFGVAHEADQFYRTGSSLNKRNLWYRRILGWWWIKCFDRAFVLAPEVQNTISQYGAEVGLLSTTKLAEFVGENQSSRRKEDVILTMVGALDQKRRDWKVLLDFDPEVLRKNNTKIVLSCDIKSHQGEAFLEAIKQLHREDIFICKDYRPDDQELLGDVQNADCILCFYANDEYMVSKTSGARHLSLAFDKPFLATQGGAVWLQKGSEKYTLDSVNDIFLLDLFKRRES